MTMAMQVITDTKFSVVYLDSTNGFSACRCKEILLSRGTQEKVRSGPEGVDWFPVPSLLCCRMLLIC